MRLQILIIFGVLLIVAQGQVVPKSQPLPQHPYVPHVEANPPHHLLEQGRLRRRVDVTFEWQKAWCKGAKLAMGMIKSEAQAAAYVTPVRSPWDGDLAAAFRTWGYRERPGHRADLCDFGAGQHDLQRAFAELKIDTRSSSDGGPNTCYHIEHQSGPTVERDPSGQYPPVSNQWYSAGGRRLRVTEAFTTLGINPVSGVLYFLNRLSPLEAAHENWDIPIDQVQKKFLPDLSSSSDHAWGFWNRANVGGDLANINKIFACMITNAITLALIAEALRTYPLPPGVDESQRPRSVEKWPGTTFEMHYDAAQVLLGSPNGQAAGYFLAQHKHRFGKSKTIDSVTVFRADVGIMPYLLFEVIDAPTGPGEGVQHLMEERIVEHSKDGKNTIREHTIRAEP